MTIAVMCVAQEGQIPPDAAATLEAELTAFTERAFDAPAQVDWITVPDKCGFTAAQPSTSMIVSARANRDLPRGERATLLKDLCDLCIAETGKTADELVLVISDPQN